ncbi:hypothetical protein MCOR27_005429 [Pyricularia oryzae]|uniref:BRCT domain-containing protein n=2 Tax=Pyricularia TaxID=48558 RepID=A0ABQ8N7Z1_PYRGI|nr:hypothetical protein MCOR01_007395 [Pyricularia oryzae]KAI6292731.1 hypothetical protein MCOR33_009647 [Pyricularia grisea]KAH9434005.1 hypothetical protein MCOR02_006033 [Pyricularia oryzae]KAI6260607.1 hypothetical protein MCOR19_003076 [Pyricularia oryzae]KAI6278886.1 hypothetical protein MCOR27_005429 [Pyricularia oryzae]
MSQPPPSSGASEAQRQAAGLGTTPLSTLPQNPKRAAEPQYGRRFDPWNAVSLGHQRSETNGPLGWRESRAAKLGGQFRAGYRGGGGERMSDAVGRGSKDFDESLGVVVGKDARARAACSVVDMLRRPGAMKDGGAVAGRPTATSSSSSRSVLSSSAGYPIIAPLPTLATSEDKPSDTDLSSPSTYISQVNTATDKHTEAIQKQENHKSEKKPRGGIFDGLVIYVNGSTHPLISDHKLKHVLAENGARMTIHLGRRQVTHVILGRPAASSAPSKGISGAGGGLAAGKLEREIRRVGGCGVKFVGVEWILESVKAGRRLPEARFAGLKMAAGGQQSVYDTFSRPNRAASSSTAPGNTTKEPSRSGSAATSASRPV